MTLRGIAIAALVWTGAVDAAIGQAPAPPAAAQSDVPSMLPKDAREVLEKKWKRWTVASIDPQATSCQSGTAASVPLVTADFDSDTLPDYALAVQTHEGVKLVALLRRGNDDYLLFELDDLGQSQASAFLGLEKRGTRFVNPSSGFNDFFSAETLAAHRCGSASVVYLWVGTVFRRVELARS
jgi:hypothetical protein